MLISSELDYVYDVRAPRLSGSDVLIPFYGVIDLLDISNRDPAQVIIVSFYEANLIIRILLYFAFLLLDRLQLFDTL